MTVEDYECSKVLVLASAADTCSTKIQAKWTREWLFCLFVKIDGSDLSSFLCERRRP